MNKEISSALLRVLPFALIIFVLLLQKKRGKITQEELALQKPFSFYRYAVCTIGFLVFVITIEYGLHTFGLLEVKKWNHTLISSFIRITGAVILAPVAEELIFRGLLLSKLSNKVNKHAAILLQAILFVTLHNFAYENTLTSNIGIAQSLLDAVLFGYSRFYTKSIYTSITMHITGNFIATLERFIL